MLMTYPYSNPREMHQNATIVPLKPKNNAKKES
jgi:hypothetical protein